MTELVCRFAVAPRLRAFALALGAFALTAGPCALAAVPAGTLTLEAAVREGRAASPRLARSEASVEEARWRKHEALSGFLPKVSATASHFLATRYQLNNVQVGPTAVTMPLVFPTTSLALDFSLPVFDGLQNVRRYSAVEKLGEAAQEEVDWTGFQVAQDIRLKFYQALASRKLEEVARQNVTTLEDHLQKIRRVRQGGAATDFDVLRVEVQLHEAESEALSAEDNVILARRRLAEVMGLEQDERALEGELPVPAAARVDGVKEVDWRGRGDLEGLRKRLEAADRTELANRAWWVPRISLGGQYLFYNNRTSEIFSADPYRSAYQLGVFMNWNLFDGAVSLARAKQAAAQRQQAEKAVDSARLHAGPDLEFWKRRYRYSAAQYQTRTLDIQKGKESVRLAHEGFRAGTRTNSDILDAERDLFRARAAAVNAQVSAAEALLNLQLAAGGEF